MSEPHALVQLLLKRMASHPEEFSDGEWYQEEPTNYDSFPLDNAANDAKPSKYRWSGVFQRIEKWCTKEEQTLVHEAMRTIVMDRAYDMAMDELLNGDERRREEKERRLAAETAYVKTPSVTQELAKLQNARQSAQMQAVMQSQLYQQNILGNNLSSMEREAQSLRNLLGKPIP